MQRVSGSKCPLFAPFKNDDHTNRWCGRTPFQIPCIGFTLQNAPEFCGVSVPAPEINRAPEISDSLVWKEMKWIIKVYNRLAGPVLEHEGGAGLHFLFKCFKLYCSIHSREVDLSKNGTCTISYHNKKNSPQVHCKHITLFPWLYLPFCYPMWYWPIKPSEEWLPLTHSTHTSKQLRKC